VIDDKIVLETRKLAPRTPADSAAIGLQWVCGFKCSVPLRIDTQEDATGQTFALQTQLHVNDTGLGLDFRPVTQIVEALLARGRGVLRCKRDRQHCYQDNPTSISWHEWP
jgi:hypothetical protein